MAGRGGAARGPTEGEALGGETWGRYGFLGFPSPVAHRITHINSIIINGNSTIINSVYYNDYV